MAESPQTPSAADQTDQPRLLIQTQYVKDLSFENPRAPAILESQQRPEIQIRVDVRAEPLATDRYEVTLELHVDARTGDETTFVVELAYGGVFALFNIPQENLQPLLLVECPRLLFPFARRIVADTTRDGGFPPLMIDPIDFVTVYRARLQQQAAQAQAQEAGAPQAAGGDSAAD